jgi:hypothetical protein
MMVATERVDSYFKSLPDWEKKKIKEARKIDEALAHAKILGTQFKNFPFTEWKVVGISYPIGKPAKMFSEHFALGPKASKEDAIEMAVRRYGKIEVTSVYQI